MRPDKAGVIIMSKKCHKALSASKTSLLDFFLESPYPEVDLPIERSPELPREVDSKTPSGRIKIQKLERKRTEQGSNLRPPT